jgi:hypothetical protein
LKTSKLIKYLLALVVAIAIQGCASYTPAPPVDMSNYSKPTAGTAGIYFYQWKSGIFGAFSDVKFVLDGQVLGSINTGEWLYFEVLEGNHSYRYRGGPFKSDTPFQFDAGKNYFFLGKLRDGMDSVSWINDPVALDEATANISSGRYTKKLIN